MVRVTLLRRNPLGFRLSSFGKTVEFSEKTSCNRHENRFKILNIVRTDVIINSYFMIIKVLMEVFI